MIMIKAMKIFLEKQLVSSQFLENLFLNGDKILRIPGRNFYPQAAFKFRRKILSDHDIQITIGIRTRDPTPIVNHLAKNHIIPNRRLLDSIK